jgi:hypothetical protein
MLYLIHCTFAEDGETRGHGYFTSWSAPRTRRPPSAGCASGWTWREPAATCSSVGSRSTWKT